ncbi:MAG: hydroxymethylbilane synthase [Bacteroidota bacterium]|nr:hydroxymethylbilane synthase [Bacteroidota bacterium]
MKQIIKIGTRESQLAVWQATLVQSLLKEHGLQSELIFIKSEGDIDTITPLYELGVQGIFTKALDAALLNKNIDIAVHSLKDVPTKLATGIRQAAVLKRASFKDIFVYKKDRSFLEDKMSKAVIATSSTRRIAQWLHRYPNHSIENLRGNVNTRLRKIGEHTWHGAIFAAAGLERIGLRPENSVDLDWMLPAPAQGAITIVCRTDDDFSLNACAPLNDSSTALCTKIERDFLRALLGGCSTPISALASLENEKLVFKGNVCSPDGRKLIPIEKVCSVEDAGDLGSTAGAEFLQNDEAQQIIYNIRNAEK